MTQKKAKREFESLYCRDCHQAKPCGVISSEAGYCCKCLLERSQKEAKEHSSLEQVLSDEKQERENRVKELQLLKNYAGCPECKSKLIDSWNLYQEKQLVCQPCLMAKEGGASGEVSLAGEARWYKKRWGINLDE